MRPGADRYTPDDTADRPASSAESGFAEAYRVHRLGLVKLAAFIVGDQATGEDVVQDVFTQERKIAGAPPPPAITPQTCPNPTITTASVGGGHSGGGRGKGDSGSGTSVTKVTTTTPSGTTTTTTTEETTVQPTPVPAQ